MLYTMLLTNELCRLSIMNERVEDWSSHAKTLLVSLEELTPELLVA